jgi:hypothetical protein
MSCKHATHLFEILITCTRTQGPAISMIVGRGGGGGSGQSPTRVTLGERTAGAVTNVEVSLYVRGSIPSDGRVLVQMPPGFTFAAIPEFVSMSGEPVRAEVHQGTFVYYAPTALPYYTLTNAEVLVPPASIDEGATRGPSIMLTRLGGGATIPDASRVVFNIPSVRLPPFEGPSGGFEISTMVNWYALLDINPYVPGPDIIPGYIGQAQVETSSIVSDAVVTVRVNFTTTNPLPRDVLVDVSFPAGYRGLDEASLAGGLGFSGTISLVGVASDVGGMQVVRVRHVGTQTIPRGSSVQLVLSNVRNRMFSSTSQYFKIETRLNDVYFSLIDVRSAISVPPISQVPKAFFALAVDERMVKVFDPRATDYGNDLFSLEAGDTVVQGVSALNDEAGLVYLISGGKLVALDLTVPAQSALLLRSGADAMENIASMKWDRVRKRLLALAMLDGESVMVTVNTMVGVLTRMSDLPACGSCECSPAQVCDM